MLVTTALGNIGRAVARECAARGLTVRVSDRDEAKARAAFPAFESVRFDFFDRGTWAAALDGCDRVFLLRPPPVGDMDATLIPFIDQAYAASTKDIVFLSVARADEMRWVPHRKVELHLFASGAAWTVLRPGFFAQNLEGAYRSDIVDDDRIFVPTGRGRVAFIDAADVGAVAACVLADPAPHRGRFLTLTGPDAITFDQVAALLTAELRRPIRYEAASIPAYAWHLRRKHALPWMQVAIQTILHVGLRAGDAERVESTVARLLGRGCTRPSCVAGGRGSALRQVGGRPSRAHPAVYRRPSCGLSTAILRSMGAHPAVYRRLSIGIGVPIHRSICAHPSVYLRPSCGLSAPILRSICAHPAVYLRVSIGIGVPIHRSICAHPSG